jgi:hypothetical protein
MQLRRPMAAFIFFLAVLTPALAAAPFDGRWAATLITCSDEGSPTTPITVTSQKLSWAGVECFVGASYLVRDAWHLNARCWGEGRVSDVPIRLQLRGERLVVDWAKARPEELRRCP